MEKKKRKKLKENSLSVNTTNATQNQPNKNTYIDNDYLYVDLDDYEFVNRNDLIIEEEWPSWLDKWASFSWENPEVVYFEPLGKTPQVLESLEKKTSVLNYDILEKIEKHDVLNPKLWKEDGTLKLEVEEKILDIVELFLNTLEEDGIDIQVKDIVLVGSNCSYNYNDKSDLDIHIRVDDSIEDECDKETLEKLYSAYRSIFNKNYDIEFYNIPVELYVETDSSSLKSNGIYSLYTGWIKEPRKEDIPNIDIDKFEKVYKVWEEKCKDILNSKSKDLDETINDIDKLLEDTYNLRKQAMESGKGEYDIKNLVFKELRNQGYLDKLKDLKKKLISKKLSLKERYLREEIEGVKSISTEINNIIKCWEEETKEGYLTWKDYTMSYTPKKLQVVKNKEDETKPPKECALYNAGLKGGWNASFCCGTSSKPSLMQQLVDLFNVSDKSSDISNASHGGQGYIGAWKEGNSTEIEISFNFENMDDAFVFGYIFGQYSIGWQGGDIDPLDIKTLIPNYKDNPQFTTLFSIILADKWTEYQQIVQGSKSEVALKLLKGDKKTIDNLAKQGLINIENKKDPSYATNIGEKLKNIAKGNTNSNDKKGEKTND